MIAPRSLLCAAMLLLSATPVLAQTGGQPSVGEVSRLRTEISNEIYSPFCPGKTLMMCTSPNAAAVRRDIQDMVREGKDKERIKNEIVARYGEEFRLVEPPAQDNVALAALIIIGFLLAAIAVFFFSRRKLQTTKTGAPLPEDQPDDLSEDERDYLDELRAHVKE